MASPLLSRSPQCLSCVRRITNSLFDVAPAGQQIRGKKRLAKVTTVKVQLLQNVPGYGRRGAVIPVTAGVMRNIWYPKHMAEYVTATKAKELGVTKNTLLEREYTFRSEKERKIENQAVQEQKKLREFERLAAEAAEAEAALVMPLQSEFISAEPQEPASVVEIELLSPDQTISILDVLLPPNLDFYRTQISATAPKARPVSPSIAARATTSTGTKKQEPTFPERSIYGSVTTSDIAADIRGILAEDENGMRVVLPAENISFVEETEEKDRVKRLGVFEIEIKVEGAADVVKRTISVKSQE